MGPEWLKRGWTERRYGRKGQEFFRPFSARPGWLSVHLGSWEGRKARRRTLSSAPISNALAAGQWGQGASSPTQRRRGLEGVEGASRAEESSGDHALPKPPGRRGGEDEVKG